MSFITALSDINTNSNSTQNSVEISDEDVAAFEKILKNYAGTSSELTNSSNNINNANKGDEEFLEAMKKSAKVIEDASKEAIEQRAIDKKNAMQAQTSATAVKQATEIFKEIKF